MITWAVRSSSVLGKEVDVMAVKTRVVHRMMATRVVMAFLDPGRFPDVPRRKREERRNRIKALPKTLLKTVREFGQKVREKSKKELSPKLRDALQEFGDLVRKHKSRDKDLGKAEERDLGKAEELIMRDPKRLEQALSAMSPEELKELELRTVKALGAIGSPFWDS